MKLDGQVALVTGAGRGIGRSIAKALSSEGAWVGVNDIEEKTAETLAKELNDLGVRALPLPGDVSQTRDVQKMIGAILSTFGRLDILINNAGIETRASVLEMTEAEFDRVLAVDLKGIFLCSKYAAQEMLKTGGGKIVNITSICAQQVWTGYAHYCAAKAGADMLTKVLAAELAPFGIRVNAIAPGTVDTEMARTDLANPEAMNWVIERTPAGRLGRPEDISKIVIFLVADAPDWLIGDILTVDGGYRLPGDPPSEVR
jgi:NAD(P)-dependent dehydrogenase (short-subunit alcohol dehydrogenase family)